MRRLLFRALRYYRDARAVARGRVPQRLWNRAVSAGWRRIARKVYK